MISNQIIFIFKVVFVSTLFSFLVKYGGRLLTIKPNNFLVIIIVLLPSFVLGLILGFRSLKKQSISENDYSIKS